MLWLLGACKNGNIFAIKTFKPRWKNDFCTVNITERGLKIGRKKANISLRTLESLFMLLFLGLCKTSQNITFGDNLSQVNSHFRVAFVSLSKRAKPIKYP